MKTGAGMPNKGFVTGGGIRGFIVCVGECILFTVGDACSNPAGLHILRSCAFGVEACRIVCDVTVEHLDGRRFRKFLLFLRSFLASGDFCSTVLSSETLFISFAVGATVINGRGDFFSFSGGFVVMFSGDLDFSEFGEPERLLQFFIHSSGVMRLDPEEAAMRCGLRSKWACVSRQKMCILYWFRHLSEQNWSCVAPSWELEKGYCHTNIKA